VEEGVLPVINPQQVLNRSVNIGVTHAELLSGTAA
jgi:hypothetical protein